MCSSVNIDQLSFLVKGVIIGFSIAAPIGPIGVLCIQRTLANGRASGLVSGVGAATADAIYGSIAGFGLTFVSNFLIGQEVWVRLVGGVFLCILGIRTFLYTRAKRDVSAIGNRLAGAYASTFFLTLTNPMTVLSFAAIFAGLGLASATGDYVSAVALISGVFVGSILWWIILSCGVSILQARFSSDRLQWMNKVSGLIIAMFGLIALASLM